MHLSLTDEQFIDQVFLALEEDNASEDDIAIDLYEYAGVYFGHKGIEVEESARDTRNVLELLRKKALKTGDAQKADEFRKLKKELVIESSAMTDIYDKAEGIVASSIDYTQKTIARTNRRLGGRNQHDN